MLAPSIGPELLAAYVLARYEVPLASRWIDCRDSGALALAVDVADCDESCRLAVLSACNPRSRPLPACENRLRHQRLCAELRRAALPHRPARGRAPDSNWVEAGVLLRAPLAWIDAAARRWEQNAVWLPGPPACLRLYADAPPGLPSVMANVRLEWVGCGPPAPSPP